MPEPDEDKQVAEFAKRVADVRTSFMFLKDVEPDDDGQVALPWEDLINGVATPFFTVVRQKNTKAQEAATARQEMTALTDKGLALTAEQKEEYDELLSKRAILDAVDKKDTVPRSHLQEEQRKLREGLEASHEKAKAAWDSEEAFLLKQINHLVVDQALAAAAQSAGVEHPQQVVTLLKSKVRAKRMETNGVETYRALVMDGEDAALTLTGEPLGIAEYVAQFLDSDEGQHFVKGKIVPGSGERTTTTQKRSAAGRKQEIDARMAELQKTGAQTPAELQEVMQLERELFEIAHGKKPAAALA